MIKHRLTKKQLTRIVTVLTEKLYERTPIMKNSIVGMEILKKNLEEVQYYMAQMERNHVWSVPMQMQFDENGSLKLIPDMNYILILDFDT